MYALARFLTSLMILTITEPDLTGIYPNHIPPTAGPVLNARPHLNPKDPEVAPFIEIYVDEGAEWWVRYFTVPTQTTLPF